MLSLPNELLLSTINSAFPCRQQIIRSLAILLSLKTSKNIVLYGSNATGKSAIAKAVLGLLSKSLPNQGTTLRHAIIRTAECITPRHLVEKTVRAVADVVGYKASNRCESTSQMVNELEKMAFWMQSQHSYPSSRLVLAFDGIDRQSMHTAALPALAKLAELIPGVTCVFIVTNAMNGFLHAPGVPHIHFPSYTKAELQQILSHIVPTPQLSGGEGETKDVWFRFCGIVWDSLSKHSSADLVSMRSLCFRLWPRFIRPILDGTHTAKEFSKVMVVSKYLFQDEAALVPSIVSEAKIPIGTDVPRTMPHGIASQLPYYSRLLLVAAYFASHNKPATDQLFFMKGAAPKRRKKGGGTAKTRTSISNHRKISRKLLGPQAFIMERMLAIFSAILADADGRGKYAKGRAFGDVAGSSDVQMAIATLMSLRLIIKTSNSGDVLEGTSKYRVAVNWDVIRAVARSVGVEPEDYLEE
ncbi:origin recognition complex subunit 5 C-terminus-domain-containing protein [Calycina marina]|uniref:Origin recognition complex subunit 5 C-terminus-domain-containing protein n=1 Tax=Calycina marina TaxID=1763456 RepID=A0A9P7YY85_9HELO|nr:origin recognition complex subunit 5 C-terminus-domain-containing protein [Calycina marina]